MYNKKNIIVIFLILILLIIFITAFVIIKNYNNYNRLDFSKYKNPYENEPNNNFDKANKLELTSNIYGKIDNENDIDFYSLYNNDIVKKVFNIYLTDIGINDLTINVYNQNKKILFTTTSRKLLNVKIQPKTLYYIKIFSKNGNFSNLTYNLIIKIQDKYNKFLELEPDNSFENANNLDFNYTISGKTINFDKDFYVFKIDNSGFFLISLTINNSPLNLNIFSRNKLLIYSLKNLNKSVIISPIFFTKGIYFIEISGKNSKYLLFLNKAFWEGEVEFNNTKETANEFSISDNISGSIGWPEDIDYYKIFIKNSSKYSFYINKKFNSNLKFSLINKDGKIIKDVDLSNVKNFLEIYLNKGYYYLQFKTINYVKPLNYSFRIAK